MTLHPLSQIADVIKRRDTPKSLTQQGKFKTYPVAMSGVLDSSSGASGGVAASFASRVFFTHLPNVISCTSILRATSAIDRWSSMIKVTAFALYSSVKLRRVEPILSSPD